MNNEHVIFDTPLPEAQNFHWLKAKGIEYAQQLSGTQWTNFNDSDPGVTILDQLCYALTELGYCINFRIEDILAQRDGSIKLQDQFYLPEQILTCSPVTVDDYRKLILDSKQAVKNVYIEPDKTGCYEVYLYVEPAQEEPETLERYRTAQESVYALLNQYRNLAELFRYPVVLTPKTITLSGIVKLTDKALPSETLSRIQLAVDRYISPPVQKFGYQEMLATGLSSDEIFNGPGLNKGWIPTPELAAKLTVLSTSNLSGVIAAVNGVKSVSGLKLQIADVSCDQIAIETPEIAQVVLALTVSNNSAAGDLSLCQQLSFDLLKLQQGHQAAKVGAEMDVAPEPPQGKFRNIESYYSIQNTFPPVYALGADSLPVDSPNYRVAQSRQLKGYLMVFDQLLADQFSQLANVQTLFSFKGASTIAPKQGAAYDGIPYQLFSPTYFCQPLYQIPDVKPLLRGHDTYRISITPTYDAVEEEQIWQRYQADPFNQYIQGLRQNMEDDAQRDDRRNRMLDHLLARHGEPALFYDGIISTARWYGSTLKTRIIIKNILLQNYATLSYKRTKAYNLFQAEKLGTPGRYRLSSDGFSKLPDFDIDANVVNSFVDLGFASPEDVLNWIYSHSHLKALQAGWDADKVAQFEKECLVIHDGNAPRPSTDYQLICDGQLNLQKLEALEQLRSQDFDNYATVELQINLLLGLRQHYELLAELLPALIRCAAFNDWLKENGNPQPFTLPDSDITVNVVRFQGENKDEDHILFSGKKLLCIKSFGTTTPQLNTYQAHLEQIQWLATQRRGILLIETLLLLEPGGLTAQDMERMGLTPEMFYLRTLLIFPDYVTLFGQATLKQNLDMLSAYYWPAHLRNNILGLSFISLKSVIRAFVDWRNSLRNASPAPNECAALAGLLLKPLKGEL